VSQQLVIALDQGTTSSRAVLFDHDAELVDVSQQEFTQHFPKPGWVEHDANEIWDSQFRVLHGIKPLVSLFITPLFGKTVEPPAVVMRFQLKAGRTKFKKKPA